MNDVLQPTKTQNFDHCSCNSGFFFFFFFELGEEVPSRESCSR